MSIHKEYQRFCSGGFRSPSKDRGFELSKSLLSCFKSLGFRSPSKDRGFELFCKVKDLEQRLKEKDEVITSQEKERQSTERFWKEKFEHLQSQLDEANKVIKKCEGILRSGLVISPNKDTHSDIIAYQEKYLKKEEA